MSAFEQLERQLMESVAERSEERHASPAAGLARWWRTRIAGGTPLAAMLSLLFVLVTVAGTVITRVEAHSVAARGGERLLASVTEAACGPCRAVGGRLHAPPSEEANTPEATAGRSRREVHIRYGRPIVGIVTAPASTQATNDDPVG